MEIITWFLDWCQGPYAGMFVAGNILLLSALMVKDL
jgi:hypothetical protein